MAQLLRGYPGRGSHNRAASIVNAPPNLFLPTGIRTQTAVRQAVQFRTMRYKSVLRPPTVLNAPNIFLPTGAKRFDSVNRARIIRRFTYVTRLRPPAVINPMSLRLPTGPRVLARPNRRAYRLSTILRPPVIINYPPAFLPTIVKRAASLADSRHGHSRLSTRLSPPMVTTIPVTSNNADDFFIFF